MNLKSVFDIISELKKLDLSKYPIDDVKLLMGKFDNVLFSKQCLPIDTRIIRARLNDTDEIFSNVSELSYKKPSFNGEYKRASTPNNTMFYGCVVPEFEISKESDYDNAINTVIFEMCENSNYLNEYQDVKLTFCEWTVTKEIDLFGVVYHKEFIKNSVFFAEANKECITGLNEYPQFKEKSNIISEYFAFEFAKNVQENSDYIISALFTENALRFCAGVLFPSVKAKGNGINVAIDPNYVDNNMRPIRVWIYLVSKLKDTFTIKLDSIMELEEGQTEFTLGK